MVLMYGKTGLPSANPPICPGVHKPSHMLMLGLEPRLHWREARMLTNEPAEQLKNSHNKHKICVMGFVEPVQEMHCSEPFSWQYNTV